MQWLANLKQISLSTGIVTGFAAAGALALALTDLGTRDAIAENERQEVLRQLAAVMPASSYNNDPLAQRIQISDPLLGSDAPVAIYRGRQGTRLTNIAIEAIAPNGYSGEIRLLIGVDATGTLTGVRTIAHKETAGLGDKIDENKSDWITKFTGKSLTNPDEKSWAVTKDGGVFDSFTGATITPRAVVQATANALRFSKQHWQTIADAP